MKSGEPVPKEVVELKNDLARAQATIAYLKKQEALLRTQFAFYIQHGAQPWSNDAEIPKIGDRK